MKQKLSLAFLTFALATVAQAQLVELNVAQSKPTFGDIAFGNLTARGNDGIDGTVDTQNYTHADYPTSATPYPGEIDVAPNPYWQVDLGEPFVLTKIELVDRIGCCDPSRLDGSTITLFDSAGATVGTPITVTAGPSSTAANGVFVFDNAGAGWAAVSSIRIDGLATNQYFQFSELRAFSLQPPEPVNAALGAPVSSSGATWGSLPALNITDGNVLTHSHPLADLDTLGFTYTIDLGQTFNLEEIVLWNRSGCCPERLSNYRVSLHPDIDGAIGAAVWTTDIRTDGSNSGDAGSDSLLADLDPGGTFAGQYIIVENLSNEAYNPQLAEIQALTYDELPEPPTNLALGATVGYFDSAGTPVDTWAGLPASNVTDGNPFSITHPLEMTTPGHYLQIDLGEATTIGSLDITGRQDCCTDRLEEATLELLDADLNVISSQVMAGQVTATQTFEFPASPAPRYIRITNSNGAGYGPQVAEVAVHPPSGPVTPFEITALSIDNLTGDVSLTFNSQPGVNYKVFAANSLPGIPDEKDDNLASQGLETTTTFNDAELIGKTRRFYWIEK